MPFAPYVHFNPVLPKPFSPRTVAPNSDTSTTSGAEKRWKTNCAIRSPRLKATGSVPLFCRITLSSPR